MQLSKWSDQQLISLASIYIKHKRLDKSAKVHNEIATRIEMNHRKHLAVLLDDVEQSNCNASIQAMAIANRNSRHAA